MDKTSLRKKYKSLRDGLSPDLIEKNSASILNFITSSKLWKDSARIMCYLSFGGEIKTRALIQRAWQEGKEVVIPICQRENKTILPSLLYSFSHLEPKTMGILEPIDPEIKEIHPQTVDLCLIPGIAFDYSGNRIGFGAGYYDHFLPLLKSTCPKVALAHHVQISKTLLPFNKYDVPMDYICSEKGPFTTKGPRSL